MHSATRANTHCHDNRKALLACAGSLQDTLDTSKHVEAVHLTTRANTHDTSKHVEAVHLTTRANTHDTSKHVEAVHLTTRANTRRHGNRNALLTCAEHFKKTVDTSKHVAVEDTRAKHISPPFDTDKTRQLLRQSQTRVGSLPATEKAWSIKESSNAIP